MRLPSDPRPARLLSLALCLSLALQPASPALAAAADIVARRADAPAAAPTAAAPTAAAPGLPALPGSLVAPPAADVSAPASVSAAAASAAVAQASGQVARPSARAELRALPVGALSRAAGGAAARRLSAEGFDTRASIAADAPAAGPSAGLQPRLSAPASLSKPVPRSPMAAATIPAGAERRSALSGLVPLVAASAAGLVVTAAAALTQALGGPSAEHVGTLTGPFAAGVWAMAATAAVSTALTAADSALFVYAMLRGRGRTADDLGRFVRAEAAAGRLDPSMIPVIRAFEPAGKERWRGMVYGFAAGGFVYVRPELAAMPWLFRLVLVHEQRHVERLKGRGPPPSGVFARAAQRLASEASSYWAEASKAARGGLRSAAELRLPTLERVLRQTQMSMQLERSYDVLVVNPVDKDLRDEQIYRRLSSGRARVETLESARPQAELAARAGRYNAVVLDQSSVLLPEAGSEDDRKLSLTLKQLESLHILATRGVVIEENGFNTQGADMRLYRDLAEKIGKAGGVGAKAAAPHQQKVREFWRQVAGRLDGVPARGVLDSLYGSLQDKGLAFLTFRPQDHGAAVWEKLLRYWQHAGEGGQFRAVRVDLEDGGHVLAMRKVEDRKPLWLAPLPGNRIEKSIPDAGATAETRAAARQALIDAGFAPELPDFDRFGVHVEHVFGEDVGRQLIGISVPRAREAQLRGMATAAGAEKVEPPPAGYEPHLMDSPQLVGAPGAWRLGFTGEEDVATLDTGADETHEDFGGGVQVVDLTREGKEEWNGHGTVVASIFKSVSQKFPGIAPAARLLAIKVFGRDMMASDAPIMAGGTIALQRGLSIINASLGMRGDSSSKLAQFFSDLSERPNAKGEHILFVGSAGNSGPGDRTLSSPGVSRRGLTVAAAAKSMDDKTPEIAFYSSVGPDSDPTAAVTRLLMKPDVTCIGGDVTTKRDDPNIYPFGVFAAKSKDMPPSPSDMSDRRHTAMSGTSMASPMCAAAAADVRTALRKTGAMQALKPDEAPWALKAVLMQTADDMGVPAWFQGAGLANVERAVDLVRLSAGGGVRASLALKPGFSWLAGNPRPGAFDWVRRYRALVELEDGVYKAAGDAKSQAQARIGNGLADDPETPPEGRAAIGDAAAAEALKAFAAARADALPKLRQALKDDSWLVRRQAAMTLLNFKAPDAALDLAEAALNDADPRVRQTALLALAETPTHAADVLLQKAANDPRWDVAIYSAYALARRGDLSAVARIARQLGSGDKRTRFTAVWLLGQLGKRASKAEAEALSGEVVAASERGNIRHLAAAALANVARSAPDALTPQVVRDLLGAAGLDNLALTRTIEKVFPIAAADKGFVERLKREPLRSFVVDFVNQNKAAATKTGALTDLVVRLAKLLDISLDEPTPQPNPTGVGVAGVDPLLGPLDLLVELPPGAAPSSYWDESRGGDGAAVGAAAGLDAALLGRMEARVRAALPLSGALWVSVPEHKLYAFTVAMERLGLPVRLPLPRYSAARRPPVLADGPGLTLDVSRDAMPAIPTGADLSVVRVRAGPGASDARVAAALEAVAAAAKPLERPTVLSVDAVPAASLDHSASLVSALVSRLVLDNVGVVLPAGNEGPRAGTVAAPGSSLAAVVGAAARATGLHPYSGRGLSGEAPLAWTDLVDELSEPSGAHGTGEAAERSAVKLAALGKQVADAYAKRGRTLPNGWFLLVRSAVERTLAPMRAHAPHEVGGGLFSDAAPAVTFLDQRLLYPDVAANQAATLMKSARDRYAALAPRAATAGPVVQAAAAVLQQLFTGPTIDAASRWIQSAADSAGQAFAGAAAKPSAANGWWADPAKTLLAETVPVYAMRREGDDPGVGKWTDLARYYREKLAKLGVGVVLLLPHFAPAGQSPYAPVSLYAVSEDAVDWAAVPEVARAPALRDALRAGSLPERQAVDYDAVRAREAEVARRAYDLFAAEELAKDTPRARDFARFVQTNARWLDEYADFMALSAILGGAPLTWTANRVHGARAEPRYAELTAARRYAQWNAYEQLRSALKDIHDAGGKALFDVPMFRSKKGLDAWLHPERFKDLSTRNPGIENQWVHEHWTDLALWDWTELKKDGYGALLDPFAYWLDFGFDGARVDALHFAYGFGNGQMASGDEPGEDYVKALARVFQARGALPMAEAFEGKDADARKHGMVTVGGDWKKVSSHDDPRQEGFVRRLLAALSEPISGNAARFVAFTLGDEWGDPFPVKERRGEESYWRYRVPLPSDPDHANRAPVDAGPQLEALAAERAGDVWRAPQAVGALLDRAASRFIQRRDGHLEIWAASADWFLEEWGRDTFVSLPGLLLSRGRFDEARESLRRFAGLEKGGLIPNRIPKGGPVEYNTSDGSLWFIHALRRYAEATGDWAFVEELRPVMERVLSGYAGGTGYQRYGRFNRVYMDSDGLIVSPAQSTWMDADPDGRDRPVTPRDGKAVDINALWYGALRFVAEAERRAGDAAEAARRDALADRVKKSFNDEFWFETPDNAKAWGDAGGALRDVVGGDPHGEAIRPNMLFAVSHGADLLSPQRRKAVVLAATKDLFTPYGMRTLSPRDSHYRERYETWKPPVEKDLAYHQGTAWPWLVGPYLDSLARVRRDQGWDEKRIRDEARAAVTPLVEFLVSHPEASLPEVFDGGRPDPALASFSLDAPGGLAAVMSRLRRDQNPGGTRSQAWSVAEVLRKLK